MLRITFTALVKRVSLVVFIGLAADAAFAQCVDSSVVNNFKVRSVKFQSLFGRVPEKLKTQLEGHKGDSYSALQASNYISEIDEFLDSDPIQQKYEQLIANKLKFSIKGTYTELACVKAAPVSECQLAFGTAITECVDVSIRRYSVEVDGLNSSPFLLLFPRSTLTALYEALPRPLLALNPNLNLDQDKRVGPSISVDTVTDLLDLFADKESTAPTVPEAVPVPSVSPTPTVPGDVEITLPVSGADESGGSNTAVETARNAKLLLRLKANKSLSNDFYDTNTGLVLERTRPLERFQSLKIDARFESQHLPQGDGDFLRNATSIGATADLRFKHGPFQLLSFSGNYEWSRNRFTDDQGLREVSSEHGYSARLFLDGVLKKGMTRAAVWFDGGAPNIVSGQYRRLGVLAGFGKEFIVKHKREIRKIHLGDLNIDCWTNYAAEPKKNEQSVGFEVTAGAGRAWGEVPQYARFFGGNQSSQFLYEELTSASLQSFPSGPLVRSLGHQQAGIEGPMNNRFGATSYWHANVNVSVPVANWSLALIPHAWVGATPRNKEDVQFGNAVAEGEPVCRDLKYMVKRAVRRSGMTLMINQEAFNSLTDQQRKAFELQAKPDLTEEEQAELDAARQAYAAAKLRVRPEVESLFNRDVLPISDFIADHANLIAVKPLFMFDVSHLGSSFGGNGRTLYGAGTGLQVDVVLARFEAGYVFAINREPGDPRGNFIARLVFRRLF
jgi:hypothetical protein